MTKRKLTILYFFAVEFILALTLIGTYRKILHLMESPLTLGSFFTVLLLPEEVLITINPIWGLLSWGATIASVIIGVLYIKESGVGLFEIGCVGCLGLWWIFLIPLVVSFFLIVPLVEKVPMLIFVILWNGLGLALYKGEVEAYFDHIEEKQNRKKLNKKSFTGMVGPAGGYIFDENPCYGADGWRYLEAAPAGWNGTREDPESDGDSAVKLASDYRVTIDGIVYDDWFLPSRYQLDMMHKNLHLMGLGGFLKDGYYWSSTSVEFKENRAYYQGFKHGYQYDCLKSDHMRVRPVRAYPEAGKNSNILETPEYVVGGIGPGEGYVFYDKGLKSDGWRYLEVAPAGWSGTSDDPDYIFGYYRTTDDGTNEVVGTGMAIGTGEANTMALVGAMGDTAYSSTTGTSKAMYAAKVCADYRGGGYGDWFLPSNAELDLMYKNLGSRGQGGFSVDYYWSSSENDAYAAWNQAFVSGFQLVNSRYYGSRVRPVRAF